jgi:hypothetical protein
VNRAALSRRHEGRVLINRDCSAIAGAQTTCADCAGSSGDFLTPSPPAEKTAARQDQARQPSTNDRAGNRSQFASDLTTIEIGSVNIKIGQTAFDSCNQRRLSISKSALKRDEGGIVDQRLLSSALFWINPIVAGGSPLGHTCPYGARNVGATSCGANPHSVKGDF